MPVLSLDSLTLTDTPAAALIRAAAGAGFDLVSLWVQAPPLYPAQLLTAGAVPECARLLADHGIGVVSLECFELASEAAVEGFRPALEIGARLGGKAALAINYTNPDAAETAATLAKLAEVAAEYGLGVNLEPVMGGHSPRLAQAAALIRTSGADVGLLCDPHHLLRSGDTLADIAALAPGAIRYVQLCDGPLPQPQAIAATEAVCERLYPGDGDFPLAAFLAAVPADVPLAVECPSLRRASAGMSPQAQANAAMAATRALLAKAGGAGEDLSRG